MAEEEKPQKPTTDTPALDALHAALADDDTTVYDDDRTSRAVDDIVAHESDQLLEAQDEAAAEASAKVPKRSFFGRLGHFLFKTSRGRWLLFLLIVAALGAAAGIPASRYYLLNKAGVQASASVLAVDALTQTPLKNVRVSVGGHHAQTDSSGRAVIRGLRLGPATLIITQIGFADIKQDMVVGWGSNPMGKFALKAVGVRYTLIVRDYLTEKPLAGVQARSGGAAAASDANGKLVITLAKAADAVDPVSLSLGGYRSDDITLGDPTQTQTVAMVIAQKAVYMSKENGKYDIYKSDLDGANKQLLLSATGSEDSNSSLIMSPDGAHAALVSTRDNQRGADGYLLNSLSLIDVADGSVNRITQGEQIQLIDWIGPRLIFEKVASDANTPAASRYSVVAYNVSDGTRVQLAAAAHLNAVFSAQGSVYYAVGADSSAAVSPAFYKISPDGNGKQTVLDQEVWSGQRVDYNTLNLQVASGWNAFDLVSNRGTDIANPSSYVNRLYADNAGGTTSLWVDARGDQGVLVAYDISAKKDADKITLGGLTHPLHWVNDQVIIFRVVSSTSAADYVVSLDGGHAHKIADVTNTYGFSQGQ